MTGENLSILLMILCFAMVVGGYLAAIYEQKLAAWLLLLGAAGLLIYWGWGLN